MFDRLPHFRIDPLKEVIARAAQNHAFDSVAKASLIVLHRLADRRRIAWIVPRDRCKKHGGIANSSRERPRMIECWRHGNDSKGTYPPVSWFQPNNRTEGRRNSNRAARIGSYGRNSHRCRDRSGGPPAGSSRNAFQIPRVAGWSEMRIVVRHAIGELMQICLCDYDRAASPETLRQRGFRRILGSRKEFRTRSGLNSARNDVVLQRERNSMQRAP